MVDADELKQVPVNLIEVNPFQPRRHFAQGELEDLAASIKAVGVLHPPLVRPKENGGFELVSGERRFRASQLAGLDTIPVIVRGVSNSISAQAALIENVQRVDLNPLEIAKALRSLVQEFNLSYEDLAQRIGKKRSTLSNYLRILTLPKNIQQSISSEHITLGHAKAILALEGFEKQNLLFELILRDELSVREAEEAALRIAKKAKSKRKALVFTNRDFFLDQIAEKIQSKLGTKVSIQGKGKKGRILIDYYNLDDLDRLLGHFGIE